MMGDPYIGLETKKGEFTINHFGGSNWRWSNNLTFKFNPTDKKIYLEKIENASYNLSLVEDENEDLDLDKYIYQHTTQLTNKDLREITFDK